MSNVVEQNQVLGHYVSGLRTAGLWMSIATCVAIHVWFSDLKGISTDEGIRLGVLNGNRLFGGLDAGTTATWSDVLTALQGTNYRPLYYLVQNALMQLANSRDLVLLKTANIAFLLGGMILALRMTTSWPSLARGYLLLTTYLSGYLLMHSLQVREYVLGLLFLGIVYMWSHTLSTRQDRPINIIDILEYMGYGLLIALACQNSLWIIPAWGGTCIGLLVLSENRLRTLLRLAVSGSVVIAILKIEYSYGLLERKVDVSVWDRNTGIGRIMHSLGQGIFYIVSGSDPSYRPNTLFAWLEFLSAQAIFAAALSFTIFILVRRMRSARVPSELHRHCLLAGSTILVLIMFQILYIAARGDALPIWPRYFFQHFWLFHVLSAAILGLLIAAPHNAGPAEPLTGKAARLSVAAMLLVAGLAWSVTGVVRYREAPFSDTGMSWACEWRTLAPRIREAAQGDNLVFTRPLEAYTITYSARFLNGMSIWDAASAAAAWPSSFVEVDIAGVSPPETIRNRRSKLAEAGFKLLSEETIAASPQACNLRAVLSRFRRS
jgi:hypothetical protein